MNFLEMLNANAGAIVAIATVASVALTLLLLLEARTTRNLRREAVVEAHPLPHGPGGMLLELRVRNFGPANARRVAIEFGFLQESGDPIGIPRRQGETLLPAGGDRRFLPSPDEQLLGVNEYADAKQTLWCKWSWADDRRLVWFFPKRHQRSAKWEAAALRRDFYGGWALTAVDSTQDLHDIAAQLKEVERFAKDAGRYVGALQSDRIKQGADARRAIRSPSASAETSDSENG